MIDNNLIRILRNIAFLLEIKDDNPFKSRAYSNAADIIEREEIDVAEAVNNGTISKIKGFGEALQTKITDYVLNGKMSYYEKLTAEIPESLIRLKKISGIGPKKIRLLYTELSVKNLQDLERVCNDDSIFRLNGFTNKTKATILNSLAHVIASKGRMHQDRAKSEANNFLNKLNSGLHNPYPYIIHAGLVGEMRRFADTIDTISILAGFDSQENLDLFKLNYNSTKLKASEEHILEQDVQFEFIPCLIDEYFYLLNKLTGSDDYVQKFEEILDSNGISIIDNHLYKGEKIIHIKNEESIYELNNMQFVPPELRESTDILQEALNHSIPKLIETNDLQGMLHVHTKYSDGACSIREMALKSKELGFKYIAICDHSQSAGYAGGMKSDDIKRQHEEIDKLNDENIGITILKGIESDILNDGSLDYPENILKEFELIVASIHSNFNMDKKKMTKRISSALMSPYTNILGHPTGRLLLSREGYQLDVEEIIDVAAEYHKMIEINANPYRLDLPWQYAKIAKQKGVMMAINPDSHHTNTLSDVFTGVNVARKAGLTKSDIINCLNLEEFRAYIKSM